MPDLRAVLALGALALATPAAQDQEPTPQEATPQEAGSREAAWAGGRPFRIDRGDELPIIVPREEELVFEVRLDFGAFGAPVLGTVTMSIDVEPFEPSSLLLTVDEEPGELVRFRAVAEGSYQVYTVRDVTETVILPQEWPRVIHRKTQTGTENRKRELLLGDKDGVHVAALRKDRHCKGCDLRSHWVKPGWIWQKEHHCKDCDRPEHSVWRPFKEAEVPREALDMLSAIQLARTMVAEGEDQLTFQLVDGLDVWDVELRRTGKGRKKVRAGTFDAVKVSLKTRRADAKDDDEFVGLFGMHGSVKMWFDVEHGFPVLIEGEVPVGPIDFNVSVELKSIRR